MKIQKTLLLLIFIAFYCSCSSDNEESSEQAPIESSNEAPASFTLIAVTNGATEVEVRPTFSWNAALDPDGDILSYELFIDTNNNPTTSIASNISGTTFTLQDRLTLTEKLFWKIIATDNSGLTSSSNTFSFTTRNLHLPQQPLTANAAFSGRSNHTSVVFDNKMWVLGGFDGLSYINDIWNSTDGITWTEIGTPFPDRAKHTSVVFDNKMWIIGGYNGFTDLNDIWSSSDGIIWTQATIQAAFSRRRGHTSVVFDNKMWVLGGYDGSSYLNDIWYSDDGITWVQAISTAPFSERSSHASVVFDNKIWVLGGYNGSSIITDIWHSSDGITWAKVSDFGERISHTSAVFGDKIWVIDGHDSIGGRIENSVIYSSDGVTWNFVTPTTELQLKSGHTSVVFDDKIWLIGGRIQNDVRFMD